MCACCSSQRLSEMVDVAHAICNVFTVSPYSGKAKVANGRGSLVSLLMIDMNLYCCSFFKLYFADWPKDSVFEFCFNNHIPAFDVISQAMLRASVRSVK